MGRDRRESKQFSSRNTEMCSLGRQIKRKRKERGKMKQSEVIADFLDVATSMQ
jgi:hypothetical protein